MLSLSRSYLQESSAESFFLCWFLALSRVEFQRTFFLDPQRGYVTAYWSRIRVLSSPSEGRPLAAVLINNCWIPIVTSRSEFQLNSTVVSDVRALSRPFGVRDVSFGYEIVGVSFGSTEFVLCRVPFWSAIVEPGSSLRRGVLSRLFGYPD